MSIISEALKKAERQAEKKITSEEEFFSEKPEKMPAQRVSKDSKEANLFLALAIIGIVISAFFLGSIVLFRNLNLSKVTSETQTLNQPRKFLGDLNIEKSNPERVAQAIELNGIVYEAKDNWAIINNRIVRLGDIVWDEKVVEIGKDFVRLVNESNKTERTLILR